MKSQRARTCRSEHCPGSARATTGHYSMPFKMRIEALSCICRNGFEHHAAMNASRSAGVLAEAFEQYLGWEVPRPLARPPAGAALHHRPHRSVVLVLVRSVLGRRSPAG